MTKTLLDFWVDEDIGSDHNIINATSTQTGLCQPKPTKTIKLYHKANWRHINKTISTQMEDHNLDNKFSRKDINQYITTLTNTINNTLEQNVAIKDINDKQIGLPKLIRDMIKDMKYIRKKWQQTRILYYKTLYNQHNKEIKRLIRIENNKNWENKCNKLDLLENTDDSWKHLKQIMGTNHTKPTYPTLEITQNNTNIKAKTTEHKVDIHAESLE